MSSDCVSRTCEQEKCVPIKLHVLITMDNVLAIACADDDSVQAAQMPTHTQSLALSLMMETTTKLAKKHGHVYLHECTLMRAHVRLLAFTHPHLAVFVPAHEA